VQAESGVDLDTFSVGVSFVERFCHGARVMAKQATVYHNLNAAVIYDRATLGAVVHDSDLHALKATHSDRRLNWIVVRCHRLVCSEVEVFSVIQDPLLHFKTI